MFERQTDPKERKKGPEWNLQLVAFGMLLANKDLRKRLKKGDFADWDMKVAFENLIGANRDAAGASIARILEECGVNWLATDGPPIDAVMKQLELDGEFQMAIDWLNMVSHRTAYRDPAENRQFLQRLKEAGNELVDTNKTGVLKIKPA
jgi:hypothetical protein